MIKLIIFDIGGVLVDFMEDMYIHFLHGEVLPEVSEAKLSKFIMPLIELMEFGLLSVPELEHMVGKHFKGHRINLRWVEGFKRNAKPIMSTIGLINGLNKTHKVVLLTNVSYSRLAELKDTYLKLVKVKTIFASCDLKLRKPEPAIYEYVLKQMKVKPGEVVFVDDQIENVIGAEKLGIHAIWFRNKTRLVEDLGALGIWK